MALDMRRVLSKPRGPSTGEGESTEFRVQAAAPDVTQTERGIAWGAPRA